MRLEMRELYNKKEKGKDYLFNLSSDKYGEYRKAVNPLGKKGMYGEQLWFMDFIVLEDNTLPENTIQFIRR